MVSTTEYAQLADRVYSNSEQENRSPVPIGWTELIWQPDVNNGFSGGIYQNQATGEIVVSFTGTNSGFPGNDWSNGNFPLGIGGVAAQLEMAVILYQQAKLFGNNITFTGHSLGGGLASLIDKRGQLRFCFD